MELLPEHVTHHQEIPAAVPGGASRWEEGAVLKEGGDGHVHRGEALGGVLEQCQEFLLGKQGISFSWSPRLPSPPAPLPAPTLLPSDSIPGPLTRKALYH